MLEHHMSEKISLAYFSFNEKRYITRYLDIRLYYVVTASRKYVDLLLHRLLCEFMFGVYNLPCYSLFL